MAIVNLGILIKKLAKPLVLSRKCELHNPAQNLVKNPCPYDYKPPGVDDFWMDGGLPPGSQKHTLF